MSEMTLDRRRFLQGAGSLLMGTLLFVNGPVALAAPTRSWSLPLSRLDGHQAERLLVMVRRLYPHDSMEDAVYALVVKELDSRAAADPGLADLLREGVVTLDRAAGGDWLAADAGEQQSILETLQAQPFFAQVRGVAVTALYSNELSYLHFGYEGASFPKGGYLHRGFNDLSWLPDPPLNASPKPFA